jgi:hypothetical protein
MYRTSDPYATLCPQMRAAERHAEAHERIADDIGTKLRTRPLSATIAPNWGYGREPIPVARELVNWVLETSNDPDATLAEAMFSPEARERLIDLFACARAEVDAEREIELDDARAECAAESEWERQREERIFESGGL